MKKIAFTVIGPDRPGIIAELSEIISAKGGNWLVSHMANLAGQFAGIVEIEVKDNQFNALHEALKADVASDITIVITDSASEPDCSSRTVGFEIVGKDHVGIVHDITARVASCGGSIEVMETELFSASMSGEEMFKAELHIRLPENVSVADMETALEKVSQDLMMDLLFEK